MWGPQACMVRSFSSSELLLDSLYVILYLNFRDFIDVSPRIFAWESKFQNHMAAQFECLYTHLTSIIQLFPRQETPTINTEIRQCLLCVAIHSQYADKPNWKKYWQWSLRKLCQIVGWGWMGMEAFVCYVNSPCPTAGDAVVTVFSNS